MEAGRPSKTASMVAVLRAHHYMSTQEPRVISDSLAMQLAGMPTLAAVNAYVESIVTMFTVFGDRSAAQAVVQDLLMGICARSRFVEDQLAASLARGVQQLIVLGAGLDSTAYRLPNCTDVLQIFEVDYPATQIWKRERLAAIGVAIPANLTFVPCDFEHQTLADALTAGGIRRDTMSFFSWLGVQPYLTDEAVMSTLDVVAKFPSGSELVLDLITTNGHSEVMSDSVRQAQAIVARIGEPLKSRYESAVFHERLQQRGFSHIDMVSVHDWYLRHHARFGDRFSANAGSTMLVTAQVAGSSGSGKR
jgi:methyltransferase (TIGR00027 family)